MVTRHKSNTRESELIEATLTCVANEGMHKTTVRKIADYAGVTNGLIRFYFANKSEIIRAAYTCLLGKTFQYTSDAISEISDAPAAERLRTYIVANLSPPIVAPDSLLLWANFLPLTYSDPEMADIRRHGYLEITGQFAPLIADTLRDSGHEASDTDIRRYAMTINALIDGLWLEGCMSPDTVRPQELQASALAAASNLLGVELH